MSLRRKHTGIADQGGFTLVELMISIVISAIIFGAIYTAFRSQQQNTETQIQIAQVQQNLRAANMLLTRELRMAGFDPTLTSGARIADARSDFINFTMDLRGDVGDPDDDGDGIPDPDGDVDDEGEEVTYLLYTTGGIQKLGRRAPLATRPIADNIAALEFFYTLNDGSSFRNPAPGDFERIRTIQVSIVARSARRDPAIDNAKTYFDFPSGTRFDPPAGDHFRYRFMTTTIHCRNMAYKDL